MNVQKTIKRAADIALCAATLPITIPVLAALVPAVKLSSPGPVLFVQDRVGKNGRRFPMYKLRTMRVGETNQVWSKDDENRVTSIGRLMRDYGLDELPQLYNIFRGDMSIIGPRPPLPEQADRFTEEQRETFRMRPGVLSLAAVEGRRSISPERRIQLHVEYVRRWSLALDARILFRSLFVVLGRQDADESNTAG
jgi:lipopolysaccharide/colanic/teichoic acid biosynthesis glycosyltransferase